ncbi:MAG: hypothetical protein R2769_07815 [Saprospiraceae bacterium]
MVSLPESRWLIVQAHLNVVIDFLLEVIALCLQLNGDKQPKAECNARLKYV